MHACHVPEWSGNFVGMNKIWLIWAKCVAMGNDGASWFLAMLLVFVSSRIEIVSGKISCYNGKLQDETTILMQLSEYLFFVCHNLEKIVLCYSGRQTKGNGMFRLGNCSA